MASLAPYAGAAAAQGAVPNDPALPLLWADANSGQPVPVQEGNQTTVGEPIAGTIGADANVLNAWQVTVGSRAIVIGETDSGVDYDLPDLEANIWTNPGVVGGCPAGTHGYNVLTHGCDPHDDDTQYGGHGTHVAGIMGAVGNNAVGTVGVNWQTTILPVKWLNSSAYGATSELVEALHWLLAAKQAGVNIRVINDSPSFPGTAFSQELKQTIEALGANNILFVTAAGNAGHNDDEASEERYPCRYDLPNEICVTATNNNDQLPPWANYGPHTVDLAAPGASIYSTLRDGRYGYLSGGSMAAAEVSGAAALILSADPNLSASELKADILNSADRLPALAGKVITGARLDVCRALPGCGAAAAPPAPAPLPAPPPPARSTVELLSTRLQVVHGRARIRLRCVGNATCAGKLSLTVSRPARKARNVRRAEANKPVVLTIGAGSFSLPAGQSATVWASVTTSGQSLVRAARRGLGAELVIVRSSPPPAARMLARVHLQYLAASRRPATRRSSRRARKATLAL